MLEDDDSKAPRPGNPGHGSSHELPFLHRNMLTYGREASFELIIKSKSTTGATLRISGGTRNSLINTKHKTASDGSITTTTQKIDDFPIFLSIDDPGLANIQGDTFVSVSLRINEDISLGLVSGLVYELKPLTYPSNTMRDPIPNRGQFAEEQSADPAAGAEATITVPDNEIWKITAASATLVTTSVGSVRKPHLVYTQPDGLTIHSISGQTQGINRTDLYSFATWGFIGDQDDNNKKGVFLPHEFFLLPGATVTTETTNLNVADNWGVLTVLVEKFYTGT